jgi:23S rRNA (adenine2503-C2)-methyltransferase
MSDGGWRMADGEKSTLSLPVLTHPTSDITHPPSDIPHPTSKQTECVMIPYGEEVFAAMGKQAPDDLKERRTACISSQVGCPVGCKFCASGIGGLDGNLTAGRIVEQVWRLQKTLASASREPDAWARGRITNVVFMGMGEPLSNFASVTRAIRTLTTPPTHGLGISARKITISTVGLPKAIEKLADEFDLPVTLALSLHAPNDDIRRTLIPWAEYTTIPDLLAACQKWFDKTGREITLEYIMLGDVNDRPADARELARVARTLRANINLIRYNEVKGMPFLRPTDDRVRTFQQILRDAGINVHIRASRGRDISAACGQLRHEKATTRAASAT